jgi:hypothetical protein
MTQVDEDLLKSRCECRLYGACGPTGDCVVNHFHHLRYYDNCAIDSLLRNEDKTFSITLYVCNLGGQCDLSYQNQNPIVPEAATVAKRVAKRAVGAD